MRQVSHDDRITMSLASFCNSRFHSRTQPPLLPPQSAVINRRLARGYRGLRIGSSRGENVMPRGGQPQRSAGRPRFRNDPTSATIRA